MLNCETSADYRSFAQKIQLQQQQALCASKYHIGAAAKLLQVETSLFRKGMKLADCKLWPEPNSYCPDLPTADPDNVSELCTIMLQFSPQLEKIIRMAKLEGIDAKWRRWFDRNTAEEPDIPLAFERNAEARKNIDSIAQALAALTSNAESHVIAATEKLAKNGFERPTFEHLLQAAHHEASNTDLAIPGVLLCAAASFQVCSGDDSEDNDTNADEGNILTLTNAMHQQLLDTEETLGFWGFSDSGFTLQVNKRGAYYVTMRGDRYSLCGKPLTKLLPFVESETKVPIDPFKEAFQAVRDNSIQSEEAPFAHTFREDDLEQLRSTVDKISLKIPDRARHNFGHCQEDIYTLRTASKVRIPDAVVWPSSESQVSELISFAKRQYWCLIPFGGGTNVTQATRCPPKEIEPRPILSVDMRKLNRVLWLNEEDGVACVEAGITGKDLVSALEERGYTMGHEPDSIEFSTLGGWIATKASGMKQNKYGNIEDIVKDVRVAGPNGLVWQQQGQNQQGQAPTFGRQSAGMEFRSLLIGSEGCLGIVTSAVVKVYPLPEVKEYDSFLLSTFDLGLGFVRDIAKLGSNIPASVRLLDNEHFRLGQALQSDVTSAKEHALKMVQSLIATWSKGTLNPKSVVCATISYEGSKSDVAHQKETIRRLARQYGGIQLGARVGKAGYDLTFMIAYLRDFAMTYHFLGESFETFVPWSKVDRVIEKTKERIRSEHQNRSLPGVPFIGCRVTQLYHEGACLYFYFCMNTGNVKNASHVFSEIEHAARSEILNEGGSLSHHHGVGKVRAGFLKDTSTPAFQTIVANVKESLDPDNIFAAGNGLFRKES